MPTDTSLRAEDAENADDLAGNPPTRQPEDAAEGTEQTENADESTLTVLLALGANVAVGLLKLAAGLITGSGALLSEAAHSAGDSSTELLLLTALRKSEKPADSVHPFGYGKERYFWSLLAAVTILMSGAAFSIYQGFETIFGTVEKSDRIWINYPVLAIAFVLEGTSFRQAVNQVRNSAAKGNRSMRSYLRDPDDPTVKSVVLEDSVALVGLVVAGLGVGLHQLTGNAIYDGLASLTIGILLIAAAFALAQTCKGLLIGKQADVRLVRAISARLEAQPEIVDVVDVLTMITGVNRVLLCVRVDLVDTYSAADVEAACVRIDAELLEEFPDLDEIFIQPVPRSDAALREKVLTRYGRVLADDERSREERAASERSREERAADERSREERAADERSREERAASERSREERAASERAQLADEQTGPDAVR